MKDEEAARKMYAIKSDDVLKRISEIKEMINDRGKEWNYLFVVDLLFDRLGDRDMVNFIKANYGSSYTFSQALEVLFKLKSNEEILDILGIGAIVKKIGSK